MADALRVTLASGPCVSYVDVGERDGPALVCLPGPTDAWRSYQPILDELTPAIRAIAVTQRGHGDSDKPASGYRVEDFAGDVVSLLDALDIEQAVLAAHSGSCLTARRVALDHPGRVAGLVLEASLTSLRGNVDLEGFVASTIAPLKDPIDPEFARSWVTDTSSAGLDPDLLKALVTDVLDVPARVWREMFAALVAYDDLAELDDLESPTLLLWGDADALVTRAMQEELLRRIARVELVEYPGLGHTPRWEAPGRFAVDVASFVEDCSAAR